jgi:hypothetical protein
VTTPANFTRTFVVRVALPAVIYCDCTIYVRLELPNLKTVEHALHPLVHSQVADPMTKNLRKISLPPCCLSATISLAGLDRFTTSGASRWRL